MKFLHRFRAALLLSALAAFAAPAQTPQTTPALPRVYFGTYTTNSASQGIYSAEWNSEAGQLVNLAPAGASEDPSFLAIHPSGKYLYAVNERNPFGGGTPGEVSAFSIDPATGKLTLLNKISSQGAAPCFISLDRAGKFVFVANYDSGTVAVFPVLPDGRLGPPSATIQNRGSGKDKQRQEGPHAHWISASPDNRFVLVCDLGLDEVLIFRFDAERGTLTPAAEPFAKVTAGSGPRHAVFSRDGKFLYVNSEMRSLVTVFRYDAARGRLRQMQIAGVLPPAMAAKLGITLKKGNPDKNNTAEIALSPGGEFLYVSDRGSDAISVFHVRRAEGTIRLVANVPAGVQEPRGFALDPAGSSLLVAGQNSNSVAILKIDTRTGIPVTGSATGSATSLAPANATVPLPAPVCVVFTPHP
jgi:6-phosphogluconolactonase